VPGGVPLESLAAGDLEALDFPVGIGFHHMGTARMHPDPRRGVVDSQCRVHSVPNLYIAGSAVFPTGGTATPMLSIIALALRLADHLRTQLRP
jgi:choline dehydrogenase-like flavoprotein